MKIQKILINLLFICAMMPALSAQNQTLSAELLWQIGRIGLDDVSPDGRLAVYGVVRYDVEANRGARTLYLLDIAARQAQALTSGDGYASDGAFTPDGKRLGFLLNGKLHEVDLDSKETKVVSELPMNGFKYAPDGKRLLFTQDVPYVNTVATDHADLPKNTARVYDQLLMRHWKSWDDGNRSNIFLVDYDKGKVSGEALNIMKEPYDSPLKPFGGMEQIAWSPNSRFIAYTCRKQDRTAEAQSTNSDIFLYDVQARQTLNMSPDLKGYDLEPIFSPDGRYLAWTSMQRPGYEADRTRLMIHDLRLNYRQEITQGWEFECNHPQWSADSKALYFLSSTDFTYQLFRMKLEDTRIEKITNGVHDYTSFRIAGDGILATRHSMSAPAELFLIDPATGKEEQLSRVTAKPWDEINKGRVERRTVQTADGKAMNVWVIFPPDFDETRKYPALLYCQGGPQGALSQFFSYRWNFQMMAAQGYIVVAPCRRGMQGAGQAWCDAIIGDWAGMPMADYLSAIDELAREPWVDANRLGAVGASYGGYSVYWLAGHHEKRFKAFISHCGLFNLESFYGSTEELWFPNNDFGGPYWADPQPETYQKFSPHRFVDQWDTPMLVVHNELDLRVPLSEGLQAFTALQARGIPSRFLYFPDEGHWVTKPQNSILWQREFFKWLDQYLKN